MSEEKEKIGLNILDLQKSIFLSQTQAKESQTNSLNFLSVKESLISQKKYFENLEFNLNVKLNLHENEEKKLTKELVCFKKL